MIEERVVIVFVVVMIWLIDVLHGTFFIKTKMMYVLHFIKEKLIILRQYMRN